MCNLLSLLLSHSLWSSLVIDGDLRLLLNGYHHRLRLLLVDFSHVSTSAAVSDGDSPVVESGASVEGLDDS